MDKQNNLLPNGFVWVLVPNKFVVGVELNAKLFVVVVAGVPKLLIGLPNSPVDPDWLVVPNPPVIDPNPPTNKKN